MRRLVSFLIIFLFLVGCAPDVPSEITSSQPEPTLISEPLSEVEETEKTAELVPITEEITSSDKTPEKTRMQELLETAPTKYWFVESFRKQGAVVNGNMRRIIVQITHKGKLYWQLGNILWNTQSNDMYIYLGEMEEKELNEIRNLPSKTTTGLASQGNKLLPTYLKISLSEHVSTKNGFSLDWKIPKSPVDWMEEYKYEKPILINETNISRSILDKREKLYFKEISDGEIISFAFHPHLSMPEEVSPGAYFDDMDTIFRLETPDERGITDRIKLEDNAAILTDEERIQYINFLTERLLKRSNRELSSLNPDWQWICNELNPSYLEIRRYC